MFSTSASCLRFSLFLSPPSCHSIASISHRAALYFPLLCSPSRPCWSSHTGGYSFLVQLELLQHASKTVFSSLQSPPPRCLLASGYRHRTLRALCIRIRRHLLFSTATFAEGKEAGCGKRDGSLKEAPIARGHLPGQPFSASL